MTTSPDIGSARTRSDGGRAVRGGRKKDQMGKEPGKDVFRRQRKGGKTGEGKMRSRN